LNKRNILQQKSLKNNVIYRKASKTLECKNYMQKENMNIKYISNNNLKIISSSLYNHSNDYNNINKIDPKKEQKLVKKNLINIVLKNKNQTIQRIINQRKTLSINLLTKMIKKECNICHKLIDSHLFKIHYNSHPSKIYNWLYLGSFSNACDINELKINKINIILNCASECHNNKLPKDIQEMHLKIKDLENFKIIDYFEEANEFINNCKMKGAVLLVHCKFGISRSASFIIAYLIKYNKLTLEEALKFVKEKRSIIKPNKGFIDQLYDYEKRITKLF
jgi:protein phosphatase slingshot